MASVPSRRAVLAAAAASLAAMGVVRAQDAGSTRYRAVRVDVAPLAALGAVASAQLVARLLPAKLALNFADLIVASDPRAPVLVARIDRLNLSAFADAPSPGFGAFGNIDFMDGAGIVLAGRTVVAQTPLHVTLPAGYSGAYYLPDIDQRRIDSLCDSFASWLRREMQS